MLTKTEVALQNALTPQRHPNIVQCFGSNYEVELNQLQIFLEYVNGDDVRTIIEALKTTYGHQGSSYFLCLLGGDHGGGQEVERIALCCNWERLTAVRKSLTVTLWTFQINGSFGEVSLIENPLNRNIVSARKIALKRIRLSKLNARQKEEADYEVMLQETLSKTEDNHIVHCYGSRDDRVLNEKHIYLEYVDGSDLFEIAMNKGGVGRRAASSYFRQLLEGLAFLHGLYVAHRDIKPENLLIDKRGKNGSILSPIQIYSGIKQPIMSYLGNLKIADFGLADCYRESEDEPDRRLTRICGSYEYLSPQVFENDYSGPKNDIWSAGIVLVVMLTGDLAWDRADSNDLCYTLWKNGELPALFKKFDRSTISIISEALDIDEDRRPNSQQLLKHPWLRSLSKRSYNNNNNDDNEKPVKRSRLSYR
ncbi:kinase domain protein [Ostertagia ostertagi]